MSADVLRALEDAIDHWQPPEVPETIPQGDMPGDKIWIGPEQKQKAAKVFPVLLPLLRDAVEKNGNSRAVVALCGGSGVGKTGISSLFSYYFREIGIGSYTMSGDNYPNRIPSQNDAERLRIFRKAGIRGLLERQAYSAEIAAVLRELQEQELDSDPAEVKELPWLALYQAAGRKGLAGYLGTHLEQDFEELTEILARFKNGADRLWLKRMGRGEADLWYEEIDFSRTSVLILDWTHGNSKNFRGADITILLNSTPAETREYRRQRARDDNADSSFITMVLEIEQCLLESNAEAAQIIVSKAGELLSYEAY